MQTQIVNRDKAKKRIFSIIKNLEPIELKSLENYAEFLAKKNNEAKLIDVLRNAKSENETLSESESEGTKQSNKEIKKGKIRELKDYAKKRGW
jgi:hypothetical protein